MKETLYISSLHEQTGSLIVSMGIMRQLKTKFEKVAFYRPIIADKETVDNDIDFMLKHYAIAQDYEDAYTYTLDEAINLISNNRQDELIESVIKKYKELKSRFDFILIEGFYRNKFDSVFDFDVNLEIAKNIDAPFVSIISGKDKSKETIKDEVKIVEHSVGNYGCKNFATFVNRVAPSMHKQLQEESGEANVFFLSEEPDLGRLSMKNVKEALGAECIVCQEEEEELQNLIDRILIGSMRTANFVERVNDRDLLVFAGDRDDLLLSAYASYYAKEHPNASGIVLTGGIRPSETVVKLLKNYDNVPLPVLLTSNDTFSAAKKIEATFPKITPDDSRKIALSLGLFGKNVDAKYLLEQFETDSEEKTVTPMMFEYSLFERARADKKRIVLPESEDDRILKAADELLKLDVVNITILGNKDEVLHQASILGLDLSKAEIIEPSSSEYIENFSKRFYEMRKHKGVSEKDAREFVEKPTFFGTMMVQEGFADGMVSGASHTTADTVRPALQIIKTKPGISTVSSVFFMCLDTKVLVYGDCAIVQDPTADQLAEIAVSSAQTAKAFGLDPRVAMLSYSTGDSGSGADVDKVREATKIAKEKAPEINLDGPMQYDAATVPSVAAKKMPDSKVAGHANVLVFPDLNTGNNTYKAVQRSSSAVAIGPVLQGLNKPVNDLSRGCLIKDIINTVAITAIQAQGE